MKQSHVCQPTLGHVLLVEDDQSLSDWIRDYLVSKGYQVSQCFSGETAAQQILTTQPDILVLDGMLPIVDGLDVCKQVRAKFTGRIIMLTARDEEIDEVLGLEMGADDYVTKPVRARALLARIATQIRQLNNQLGQLCEAESESKIQLGQLCIDNTSREVNIAKQSIKVSSNEFDMLWILAERAGQIVTRDELIRLLRGFDYDGFDRTVDLKISRLRKKLGDDPKNPIKIKTVWGKGYLFVKDAW